MLKPEDIDRESGLTYTAPRVKLEDIEAYIVARFHFTGEQACREATGSYSPNTPGVIEALGALSVLSVCVLVLKNGFSIVGKSAPASPENFNAEYGAKLAYDDAVKQIWPLMGFALKDRIARDKADLFP